MRVLATSLVAGVVIGGTAVAGATGSGGGTAPATVTVVTTSITYGSAATIGVDVAAVNAPDGTPSGIVDLLVDGSPAGSQSIDGLGHTDFTVNGLGAGSHSVEADYAGDTVFDVASGTATQAVSAATPTITLTPSPSPSAFGQSVTITANLTDAAGPVVGAVVTISDGVTVLGTPTTDASGNAAITKSNLTVAVHALSASSAATANDTAAGPATASLTVNKNDLSIAAPDTAALVGEYAQLAVKGTAANGGTIPPAVKYQVFEGANMLIGDAALNSAGLNNLAVGPFTAGTHTLTLVTIANGNFNTATSNPIAITVGKSNVAMKAPAVKFATAPHTSTTSVTLSVVVGLAPGAVNLGAISGSIDFQVTGPNGTVDLGSANLVVGKKTSKASLTVPTGFGGGGAGTYSVVALYSGNPVYNSAPSATKSVKLKS